MNNYTPDYSAEDSYIKFRISAEKYLDSVKIARYNIDSVKIRGGDPQCHHTSNDHIITKI